MIKFKRYFFALCFSFFFIFFASSRPAYAGVTARVLTMDDLNRLEKITFYNSSQRNLIDISPGGTDSSQVGAYNFYSGGLVVSTEGGSVRAEYRSIGRFRGRDISAIILLSNFERKADEAFAQMERDGRYVCIPYNFMGSYFFDGNCLNQTIRFYYTDDASKTPIDVSNAFITINELNIDEYVGLVGASEIFIGQDSMLDRKEVGGTVCYGNGAESAEWLDIDPEGKKFYQKNGRYYTDDRSCPYYHVDSVMFKLNGSSNTLYIEDRRTLMAYGIKWTMDLSTLHIRYTVTTSVENGSITPTVTGIQYNDDQVINYSPNPNFRLASVKVDGADVDTGANPSSYTFKNITSNHAIAVKYIPVCHKITTSVQNGRITDSDANITHGTNKEITYSPNEGYELFSVTVDGKPVDIKSYQKKYLFSNVTTDHTIAVVYKLRNHKVLTEVVNGTITPPDDKVPYGSSKKIEYRPNEGCLLDTVTIDNETADPLSHRDSHLFSNIREDHSIKVVYTKPEAPVKAVINGAGESIPNRFISTEDVLTYNITVKNPLTRAVDATLTDTLPEYTEFVSSSDQGVISGKTVIWKLPLKPKEQKTVELRLRVLNEAKGHEVKNVANLNIENVTISSNETSNPVPLDPVKTVSDKDGKDINENYISKHQEIIYQISLTNTSKEEKNYTVTDSLPNGMVLVNADNDGKLTDNTISWAFTLAPGGSKTVKMTVKAMNEDTRYVNQAFVHVDGIKLSTNTVENWTPIKPKKDVTQNGVSMDGKKVFDKDTVEYHITVKNSSSMTSNIRVEDQISPYLDVQAISESGKMDKNVITWEIRDVPPGGTHVVGFTAKVRGGEKEVTIENTAKMSVNNITLDTNNTKLTVPVGHLLEVYTSKMIPDLFTIVNDPKGEKTDVTEPMVEIKKDEPVKENKNEPVPVSYTEPKTVSSNTGVLGQRKVGTGDRSMLMIYLLLIMCAISGIMVLKLKNVNR